MKKDSRFRFRYIESKKDSDSSELEEDNEICVFLLANVKFPKAADKLKKRQNPFAEFYSVLNNCRRESRRQQTKQKEE